MQAPDLRSPALPAANLLLTSDLEILVQRDLRYGLADLRFLWSVCADVFLRIELALIRLQQGFRALAFKEQIFYHRLDFSRGPGRHPRGRPTGSSARADAAGGGFSTILKYGC